MRALGAMYLPQLQETYRSRSSKISGFSIRRLFVKQV